MITLERRADMMLALGILQTGIPEANWDELRQAYSNHLHAAVLLERAACAVLVEQIGAQEDHAECRCEQAAAAIRARP